MMDFKISLIYWWKAIKANDRLIGSPPAPSFELVTDGSLAIAQVKLLETPAIEVAAKFAEELLEEVERTLADTCEAILFGLDFERSDPATADFVRRALVEQVVAFVNLHELFHILSGHILDLREQRQRLGIGILAETTLGMVQGTSGRIDQKSIDESYYREFEADNCALQAMLQLPMQKALIDFLSAIEVEEGEGLLTHELNECEGVPKIIGCRIVGAAMWLVVRLIESKRSSEIKESFNDHPLPAARLLSGLTTLLEEYANLTVDAVDSDRTISPNQSQSKHILEFANLVLKPLMLHLPPLHSDESSAPIGILELVQDLTRLMFGGEMTTAAGQEVLRLQALRQSMESRLSPLRYYT